MSKEKVIRFRVDEADKAVFEAWCRKNGTDVSKELRKFVENICAWERCDIGADCSAPKQSSHR